MGSKVIAIEGDATTGTEQGGLAAETTTEDSALSLDFEVETEAHLFSRPTIIRLVRFELNTNGQSLTGTLVLDTGNVSLGTISTAAATRATVDVPVLALGSVVSVRLTGTALSSRVEVSSISIDVPDTTDNDA